MNRKEQDFKQKPKQPDPMQTRNINRIKLILVGAVIMVCIGGCMVGPKLEKPTVETEESFRFDSLRGDSMINLAWWELFNDPSLDTLIYVGLKHNQDVIIALSRIDQAYAVLGLSKADLWPSLGYDISATYGKPDAAGAGRADGASFIITPSVFWELDFWGKVRRSNQAAKAEIIASEEALRLIQVSLIASIADGYFQLLDYDNQLEISRNTWKTRKKSLFIIEQRFLKGTVPKLDLHQAQQQEAIAASAIPNFERLVARTENFLSILLGQNPRTIQRGKLVDQVIPPEIPVGLPSELLQRRPDILQAEQLFYAETARIGVAQAMRFPSFSITAAMGVASTSLTSLFSGEALIYSIGGSVLGPIFNFGKNKRRVDIQRAVAEQALQTYEKTVVNAFREVDDALIGVSTYNTEVVTRQRQMIAAIEAAKLSKARYDAGQTGYLEVLETERSKFQAQLEASGSRRNQLSAYVFLYKALGGGWITPSDTTTITEK
jgi:multidrug efflux system outer membrane protein